MRTENEDEDEDEDEDENENNNDTTATKINVAKTTRSRDCTREARVYNTRIRSDAVSPLKNKRRSQDR